MRKIVPPPMYKQLAVYANFHLNSIFRVSIFFYRLKRYILRKLNYYSYSARSSKFKVYGINQFKKMYPDFFNVGNILSDSFVESNSYENMNRYIFLPPLFNKGQYVTQAMFLGSMRVQNIQNTDVINSVIAYVLKDEWLSIIYQYDDVVKFYLVTSSYSQAKLGIYVPELNIFIAADIEPAWVEIGVNVTDNFLSNNVIDWTDFNAKFVKE